ncbi:MAG: hypothetical protein Q8Q81_05525 [Oxalobacteraceae bacterium]|nr:hypothetical protein [Oxalobacteraceae bacterium]
MKTLSKSALLACILFSLAACAGIRVPPVTPGQSEAEIISKLGPPSARYQEGDETILAYVRGPWGQQTYMARLDASKQLKSYEQVLTTQKFATVKIGATSQQDILHTFGRPAETSYLSLPDLTVWTYRYKENGVWDSMMHVHFDRNGIVQKMMNGPDTWLEPHEELLGGRLFHRMR